MLKGKGVFMAKDKFTIFDVLKEKIKRYSLSIIKKGMIQIMNEETKIKEYIEESGEFWTQAVKDLLKESIVVTESAAKQLTAVNGIVISVYFHAITYSKLEPKLSVLASLFYIMPVVCWLASLVFSVLVTGPKSRPMRYLTEDIAQKDFMDIANDKVKKYQRAQIAFIVGVGFLLAVLFHYLVIL